MQFSQYVTYGTKKLKCMEDSMDRRQRKTRTAIFDAFISLLSQYHFSRITVGMIIERADIGRATFYAHFETKESLLEALCEELFVHILQPQQELNTKSIFFCDAPDSLFLHLFQHLNNNDNQILQLMAGQNHELFLQYFKDRLMQLVEQNLALFQSRYSPKLPKNFWVDHIATTFVETVRWWVENGRKETPEQITDYFFLAV